LGDQAWIHVQELTAVPPDMDMTRRAIRVLGEWQRDCDQHEAYMRRFKKTGDLLMGLLRPSQQDQESSDLDAMLHSFRELRRDLENTRHPSRILPCWGALLVTEEGLLEIMELQQEHSRTLVKAHEQMTKFEEQLLQVVRVLGEHGHDGSDDQSTNCSVPGSLSRTSSIQSLHDDQ